MMAPALVSIAIRSGVKAILQSGAPNGKIDTHSSWSEAVSLRGMSSTCTPLMAYNWPPWTNVMVTLLKKVQRSMLPWAAMACARRSFIGRPFHRGLPELQARLRSLHAVLGHRILHRCAQLGCATK